MRTVSNNKPSLVQNKAFYIVNTKSFYVKHRNATGAHLVVLIKKKKEKGGNKKKTEGDNEKGERVRILETIRVIKY